MTEGAFPGMHTSPACPQAPAARQVPRDDLRKLLVHGMPAGTPEAALRGLLPAGAPALQGLELAPGGGRRATLVFAHAGDANAAFALLQAGHAPWARPGAHTCCLPRSCSLVLFRHVLPAMLEGMRTARGGPSGACGLPGRLAWICMVRMGTRGSEPGHALDVRRGVAGAGRAGGGQLRARAEDRAAARRWRSQGAAAPDADPMAGGGTPAPIRQRPTLQADYSYCCHQSALKRPFAVAHAVPDTQLAAFTYRRFLDLTCCAFGHVSHAALWNRACRPRPRDDLHANNSHGARTAAWHGVQVRKMAAHGGLAFGRDAKADRAFRKRKAPDSAGGARGAVPA